jgi:hypothetical protein
MPRQKGRQSRYRYITNGTAVGSDPISHFRLIGGASKLETYHGATALRVRIPKDLMMTKLSCDSYSTTEDTRSLDELGYDFMVRDETKGRWVIRNEFKGKRPCDIGLQTVRKSLNAKVGALA